MQPFARSILEAIKTNTILDPGGIQPPETPEEIDTVQMDLVDHLGGIGAWKVSPWTQDSAMWAGPIPRHWVWQSGKEIEFGRYGIEVELALVRKADGTYDWAPAFELVQSRLGSADAWPPSAKAGDLFSTAGLVVGAPGPMENQALSNKNIIFINGEERQAIASEISISALLNAAGHVEAQANRLARPLETGTIIMTGARLGPLPQKAPYLYAEIEDLGAVEIGTRF